MIRPLQSHRGQLVLVTAAVVAVALVPVVLAYLQLGYAGDVQAAEGYDTPVDDSLRALERAVHAASVGVPANHSWDRREAAVTAVRTDLFPRLRTIEGAQVARGVAGRITYAPEAAQAWAETSCPGGPNRQFGPCRADRGVVVQSRAGETHPLAVGFDVRVTTPRGRTTITVVIRAVGGRA